MTPLQFNSAVNKLSLNLQQVAHVLGVDERTTRRWASGERGVPAPVARLLLVCQLWPKLVEILAKLP